MPRVSNADVEIEYQVEGRGDGPPLLLIPGLGMQLIDWPDHFIELLTDTHCVIRVDNRDRGLSTTLEGAPSDAGALMMALLDGGDPEIAYTLSDMAGDSVAVLDDLGLDAAHVVGISMGGMIAQTLAIEHPSRVLSLTSMMSTTGAADVGQPSPDALEAILSAPADASRQAAIEHGVKNIRTWASPDWYDPDEMAEAIAASWDRVGGAQAEGTARQLCAVIASPARDDALRTLDVPALVVHGTADALIDPSGGDRTAECIPNAELLVFERMGHDVPRQTAPQIAQAISALVARS